MGLLEQAKAKWQGLLDYIDANTPRHAGALPTVGRVVNQGLINPNRFNKPSADRFKESTFGLLGIVPGVGDYASVVESADLFNRGEKFAGGMAALGALPIIPNLAAGAATLGGLGVMHKVAQKIGTPLPAGPARNQAGAIVYHGSPHKFNKFDMSKIGTGEGAQAYGHGLYFAESPDVAKSYAEDGAIKYGDLLKIGKHEIPRDDWRFEAAVAAKRAIDEGEGLPRYFTPKQEKWAEAVRRRGLDVEIAEPNLYKVDIPDEAIPRMLDWDKPLSEQAPEFQDLLRKADLMDESVWPHYTGQQLYEGEMNARGPWKQNGFADNAAAPPISELLKAQGIPGIRYLDGSSRNAGQGTSNFVLFDDQLPRILEVNGQPTGLLSYADEAAKKKRK